VASRKPSQIPVAGYQALYTASLAEKKSRSQGTEGSAAASSASSARSAGDVIRPSTPRGSGPAGSASMPRAEYRVESAATAPR
jgi:hypothetical protein